MTIINPFKAQKLLSAIDFSETHQIQINGKSYFIKDDNTFVPFELLDPISKYNIYALALELFFDDFEGEWKTGISELLVTNELLLPISGSPPDKGVAMSMGSLLQVVAIGCWSPPKPPEKSSEN